MAIRRAAACAAPQDFVDGGIPHRFRSARSAIVRTWLRLDRRRTLVTWLGMFNPPPRPSGLVSFGLTAGAIGNISRNAFCAARSTTWILARSFQVPHVKGRGLLFAPTPSTSSEPRRTQRPSLDPRHSVWKPTAAVPVCRSFPRAARRYRYWYASNQNGTYVDSAIVNRWYSADAEVCCALGP